MRCLLALCFSLLPLGLCAAPMPESRFIETADGVRIRLVEAGQGRPLILVPGWTMTAEIWAEQIAAFSGSYHVIAMDPRGQGQSSKPERGYGSPQRAADIQEVIRQLGLQKAVLLGWSLGAVDAVYCLQRYKGEGLAAIVLADNSVDKHYSSGQTGARLLADLESKPYAEVIGAFIPSLFKRPPSPARLAELQALSLLTPLDAAKEALSRATTSKGLAAALAAAPLPALYLVTPRFAEEGRKLKAALGDSFQLEIFEHGGHAFFADEAPRFDRILDDFIRQLP